MQYASVNTVYQLVKRLANKDERGFFRPADFDVYAKQAQDDIFQEVLKEYTMAMANRQRYLQYAKGNYNSIEAIRDDLRNLYRDSVSLTQISANTFSFPSDYAYFVNAAVSGRECVVIDPADRQRYANSFQAAPSTSFPLAILKYDSVEILPSSVTSGVTLSYYKTPQGSTTAGLPSVQSPTWGYTTVSNVSIYNASTSINFELPPSLEYRLAQKVLFYLGIEIREADLVAIAQQQGDKEATA